MAKFRKLPLEIEAVQWPFASAHQAPEWFRAALRSSKIFGGSTQGRDGVDRPHLMIKTLEGDVRCSQGDWIIQGMKGELYPCKPDIFAVTYEAV